MDRSRRCWISSFRFFATSRSDAPVEINLVLFATPLSILFSVVGYFDRSFPAYFPHPFPSLPAFPFPLSSSRPSFAFAFSLFVFSVLFCPVSPFPCFFPFPVSLSRFLFCPVSLPLVPFSLSRLLSRLPPSPRFPLFCFSVRFPVLFPLSFRCYVCVRPFARAFVRSFVRSFVLVSVRSFVHSFVRVRVRSFVRSLGSFPAFPVLLPSLSRPPPISRLPLFY